MRSVGPWVELKTLQPPPKLCAHSSVSSIQRPVAGPAPAQPELRAACILASALGTCSFPSVVLLGQGVCLPTAAALRSPLRCLGLPTSRMAGSLSHPLQVDFFRFSGERRMAAPGEQPCPSPSLRGWQLCAVLCQLPSPPAPPAQAPHPDPATLRLNRPFPASGSGCACML